MKAEDVDQVAQLLREGHSMAAVRQLTGTPTETIRAIRDAAGIERFPQGGAQRKPPKPLVEVEGPEGDDEASHMPWRETVRPHQERWVGLLAAAAPEQLERMRQAVCRVLGQPYSMPGEVLAVAAIYDRRTADELAERYLAELGELC